MAEEEVAAEVEAVEAVYGEDCVILHRFPPHLRVHIKPRTADVSSQQFVEATIGIQASSKYPDEPPVITIVDLKGLDEQRQNHLITSIKDRAVELSSCLMLVALCEEAFEKLSSMNHPDGDCPLCLYPLLVEEEGCTSKPFMKLMSCFHCFHCECIIRWYSWLLTRKEGDHDNISGKHEDVEVNKGQCPVCRKVFLAKDIEHVLDLAGTSDFSSVENDVLDEEDVLLSNSEKERRQKFETILKLQEENRGLIEPKRYEVLLPGVYLPQSAVTPSAMLEKETNDQQSENASENSGTTPGGSSNRPSTSKHRNNHAKKHYRGRGRNPGKHASKWIPKDNADAS